MKKPLPKISIIVPVRNEEENISRLLPSLLHHANSAHEIIVVDDNSTDNTATTAKHFQVNVIRAGNKPDGWAGKCWACHVGSQHASGDVILFADADTIHTPSTLQRAYDFMQQTNADMISAPAYHMNRQPWEKLLGPFHCLIHAGASPFDQSTDQSAYAMGHFIMIRTQTYKSIGGHLSVKDEIVEDVALANRVLQSGTKYRMYVGPPICSIQMYASFPDFISGWSRLMRSGMNTLDMTVAAKSLIPLLALNGFNLPRMKFIDWVPALSTLSCFALVQNRLGNFGLAGILLFPISVGLFVALGLSSIASTILKRPITWRGRDYALA